MKPRIHIPSIVQYPQCDGIKSGLNQVQDDRYYHRIAHAFKALLRCCPCRVLLRLKSSEVINYI